MGVRLDMAEAMKHFEFWAWQGDPHFQAEYDLQFLDELDCSVEAMWCQLDPGRETSFGREFVAVRQLNHPCIVPFYGFSVVQEAPLIRNAALVMKYMTDGSLRNVLDNVKSGDRPEFWNSTGLTIIVCGIVMGLEHIHAQEHVHRDVKPANLLLDKPRHCRIGSFGWSKCLEALAHLSSEGVFRGAVSGTRTTAWRDVLKQSQRLLIRPCSV
jgi:serine/threonine protein kinase